MRRRSPTNSRRKENLPLREAYARGNAICEISLWYLHFETVPPSEETHHIFGGTSGRDDLLSNIIRLSIPLHRLCEEYKTDGRIVCLAVKWWKQELDPVEFKAASGRFLPGWLEIAASEPRRLDWAAAPLEDLRKAYP